MKLLLVFAHPDDETFSSSGTIAKLVREGATATLITATRGEAGMLGDPPVATRKNLGKVRETELRKAAKITGISRIYFLDYIDGTLHRISQKKLIGKIFPLMKKVAPDVVLTFEKNGISNHPDHKAVSKAATYCFRQYMKIAKRHVRLYHVCMPQSNFKLFTKAGFRYDHFGGLKGTPDEEITTRVDIRKTFKTKVRAMRVHITQKSDSKRLLQWWKLVKGRWEYFKLIAENTLK